MKRPKKLLRGLFLASVAWLAACEGISTIGSGDAPLSQVGGAGRGTGGASKTGSGGGNNSAGKSAASPEGGAGAGAANMSGGRESVGGATGGVGDSAGMSMGGGSQSECEQDQDCPDSNEPCDKCDNGTLACNRAYCDGGTCRMTGDTCPEQCDGPEDCPTTGLACTDCGDGTRSCPTTQCVTGKCRVSYPGCHDVDPCKGLSCGDKCQQCEGGDCNSFVASYCSLEGRCLTGLPQCGANIRCQKLVDCGAPPADCVACGSTTCAGYQCIDGACVLTCPANPDGCQTSEQCHGSDVCHVCPDDSCAATVCDNGTCVKVCAS